MSVVDHMPYDQVYGEVRRNARRDANQQAILDLVSGLGQGVGNYVQGRRQIAQDTERKAERDREFALRQRSQAREDQQYQADQTLNTSMLEDQQPGQFLYGLQGAPRGPETFGPPAPDAAESFGPPSPGTQPASVASRGVPDAFRNASPAAQGRYVQQQKQVLSSQEAVKALTPVLQHAVNEQVVDQPTAGALLAHVRQNPADLDNALNNLEQRRTASMKGKAEEEHRAETLKAISPNAKRIAQLSPKHAGEVAMLLDEYSHGQVKASEVNRRLSDIEDQAAYGPEQAAEDIQAINPRATPEAAGAASRLRMQGKIPVGVGDANFSGTARAENIKSTPQYIKAETQVKRAQRAYDEANSEYQSVQKDTLGFKILNESQKLARFEAKKARNDARTRLEKAEAAFDSLLTDTASTPGAPPPVSGAPGAPDNLDAVLDSLSPDELLKLLKGS